MSGVDAIGHTEQLLTAGVIQARQAHVLRRVPMLTSILCQVRQGEKQLQWGDRSMRAGPRQLVLMPAGQELGMANHPGASGFYVADVVSLSADVLQAFRARHGGTIVAQSAHRTATELCVPLDRHTGAAWTNLLACLASDAPPALRSHAVEGVLLALCLAGHAGPLLVDRSDPLAARITQLLMLAPAQAWTVAEVAARLHIGASTLRRRLADEGSGFGAILEQVRLGLALQNLQGTRRPIGEIAAACGYASASRFSVRFRQHYGLSPRELRAAL